MTTPPPDWTSLRLYLTALELGSIAKAAEHCGIANSAAAKRIQVLEAEARVGLIERHARGIIATAAGEVFARHARGLMDLARRLEEDMDAFAAGGAGSVRLLATASSIGGHDLAERLAAFARLYPRIVVDLRELLERGADVHAADNNGATPLIWFSPSISTPSPFCQCPGSV